MDQPYQFRRVSEDGRGVGLFEQVTATFARLVRLEFAGRQVHPSDEAAFVVSDKWEQLLSRPKY